LKVGNQYIIPFAGLKEGQHSFEFVLDNMFFEENTVLEIPTGQLKADVLISKKTSFLELDVTLTGNVDLQCDRCLEYFSFPINYSGKLFVKFKEEIEEPDDEIIFLHPNSDMLDLKQYFFDCVGLSIPIQKFHPENKKGFPGCDQEVLNLLNTYSHSKQNGEIDPRWSKLNDLLKD